ncbi:hypothetical protein Tco_1507146 [Tanacetum coccineum]
MLHGILRFDGHPSIMMGFHRNIEGIGPHMRYLWYASSLLVGNMSKYSTFYTFASGSSLWELSSFRIISINITSLSSSLVQTSSVLGDEGTNTSDSKSELNLRTFLVMNEIDGSGGVGELGWLSGLSLSSSSFSLVLSWESLCCLG